MAELPVIQTARTLIKPFQPDYISDTYIGWLNDPEIVRYSQQRFAQHDRKNCENFLAQFAHSQNHFSAVFLKHGHHIGNISTSVDINNRAADIGILIGEKSIWGQGYGREIWAAVMQALFDHSFELVTGGCMATNLGMIKIFQQTNMRPYYTREAYFKFGDTRIDSVHYFCKSGQLPS